MPPKPCIVTGCRQHALPDNSRCEQHKLKPWARRRPGSQEAYRGGWPIIRARQLREHLDCAVCGRPATEVDHIRALADGGTHDASNLRSVCHECHKRITGEQNARRRRKSQT